MLTFPAPNPLNGDGLIAELRAAGVVVADRGVTLVDAAVQIDTAAPLSQVAPIVAAHTGQPTATATADTARRVDADAALAALIQQAGGPAAVRAKLKAVVAGTDNLTAAQTQRLVAAIALVVLRDRTDT